MSGIIQPATVKKSLSAHAAIGLIAGALLYIVSLTGTVAVFYQELQRIEQPEAPEMPSIAPAAVQRGVEGVLGSEAGEPTTTHLYVHLPVEEVPRATITTDTQAVHLGPDGLMAGPEEIAWSDFLVNLHYTLTLPFSVAIALTGALIGLASIAAYAIAATDYQGDVEAVYGPIFGDEGEPDSRPAPVANVAGALSHMARAYPDVRVTYVILHDPLTRGQHVQIVGEHERRLIFGEYYAFDANGDFQHRAGLSDGDLGRQAAASTYRLHFGTFGGLGVKLAYLLFGAALTAICATGIYIWLGKRRRRGIDEPRIRGAWHGLVIGTPVALAATFAARLLAGNDFPFAIAFWSVTLIAVIIGAMGKKREPGRAMAARQ